LGCRSPRLRVVIFTVTGCTVLESRRAKEAELLAK